jgi:hypothetical protein
VVKALAKGKDPSSTRAGELGIDPTPLFATTTGILRLYADTLERPDPRR